jgi:uncharacterized membrane protein (GlpM family)
MAELLLRAVLGGLIVSAFAVVGEVWKPKTFGGLFGSAPSVALATLGIAFATQDRTYVATEARSMTAGSMGLVAYCVACIAVARRPEMPVWLGAVACWLVWGAATFWGWMVLRWLDVV